MRLQRFLLYVFSLALFACQSDKTNSSSPESLIPDNTSLAIKIDNVEAFRDQLLKNQLLSDIGEDPVFEYFKKHLNILEGLRDPEKLWLTVSESPLENGNRAISLILPYHDSIFKLDSLKNVTQETLTSNRGKVFKTTLDSTVFFSQKIGDFLFVSSNQGLVEKAQEAKEGHSLFQELQTITQPEQQLSLLATSDFINSKWILADSSTVEFSKSTVLNVDIFQNEVKFNGVTRNTDSLETLIDVFKNTLPQSMSLTAIAPADVVFLKSLSFDSFETFHKNLQQIKDLELSDAPSILQNCTEAGSIQFNDKQGAFILKMIDAETTMETYASLLPIDSYRSVPIYKIQDEGLFSEVFSPFLNTGNAQTIALVDDFVILSDSAATIQHIISSYQNHNVLQNNASFSKLMENIGRESSLFIYAEGEHLSTLVEQLAGNSKLSNAAFKNTSAAVQYVMDSGFSHVNGLIRNGSSTNGNGGISEEFSLSLDSELLTDPQFVKNHRNGEMDIIVQDINNTLYLISNEGKIYWKKTLEGKILGKISQIDILKNGRLQLVFSTKNRVYLLDRNGKDLGKFPLKFNDDITQPLSVFDYDNNKKYRLLVTQNNTLLMYDKQGNLVKGFKFRGDGSTISSQPQHFRVQGKDYIVFSQGNKLKVLSRTGKTRIDVKDELNFSENGIFLHENNFTTTSSSGELVQLAMNGRVKKENLQLENSHQMTASSKTLVTRSNNVLKIRGHSTEINYGDFTDPQIFYIDDKIYVGLTDLQTKKVYLFDSLARPISNFPVYGYSSIDLGNMDRDGSLEMVTKGNDNSIIVYEIN